MKHGQNWQNVTRLLMVQFFIGFIISLGLLLAVGKHQALSAFLGGMTAFIPSVIFAKKFFQYQGARAAKTIVNSFYVGEFFKIIVTATLFSLVFVFYEVDPLVFFLTYIAVVMLHWITPLLIDSKQNRPESD